MTGPFLSKMLATQFGSAGFSSQIYRFLDGDGKDIVLKSYEIELKDVIFRLMTAVRFLMESP